MSKTKSSPKNFKKVFQEILRYLFLITYLTALGAMIYAARSVFTARQEKEIQRQKEMLIRSVLPPFDNQPWEDRMDVGGREIFPAKKISRSFSPSGTGESVSSEFERPVAFALEIQLPAKQPLRLFMGIDLEGRVTGVQAAGYGIAEAQNKFIQELKGMNLEWISTELQAGIQDSTINRIAVCVKAGLSFFSENREEIFREMGVVVPDLQIEPVLKELPEPQMEAPILADTSEMSESIEPMEEKTNEIQ